MKRKNFIRYYPIVLLIFIVEFVLIWGARDNIAKATEQLYIDDCATIPDDGKYLRNENLITRPFVVTASAVFWRAKALTTNLNGEVI